MKTLLKTASASLGIAVLATILSSTASAGCANTGQTAASVSGPGRFVLVSDDAPAGSAIVGFWKVKFVAQNNPGVVPDGTVIDSGYAQWHSDGTEIMNSSRPPATQNFCLGVWKKIGPSTFKLNHFALSFDLGGNPNGNVNIREEVTVEHGGDKYTGSFTIDAFLPDGTHVAHIAGVVTGERITAD